jgi:hypothetical protein
MWMEGTNFLSFLRWKFAKSISKGGTLSSSQQQENGVKLSPWEANKQTKRSPARVISKVYFKEIPALPT